MSILRSFAVSDVGRKRKLNEDSFLVDEALGLYIVADGMGGHAAGEVASAAAVQAVRTAILEERDKVEKFGREASDDNRDNLQLLMERAIQKAASTIYKMAELDQGKRGMGTTLCALLVAGKKGIIGHVGDSRVYLFRNGRVHQITEDHTLIQEQMKRGIITKEQAATSDVKNVITRAVGIQASVQVDTLFTDMLPGDLYLLCSDGLHGYFEDAELPELLKREPREALAAHLVDLANERGGKDNITAVLISMEAEEDEEHTDVEAKAEMLRRIPLFQHMTYKELLALLAIAKGRQFEAGQPIITEGEPGEDLFVIFRGKVDVVKQGTVIAHLKAGGHFGEMGIVDHAPRSATVRASEPTTAISIDRETLLKLMRRDSLLAVKMLWSFVQVLSERLRNTNEALTGLKTEMERLRSLSDMAGVDAAEPPPPAPPPPPPFTE
jgi:serine/threonine protein phosphatase PrpC